MGIFNDPKNALRGEAMGEKKMYLCPKCGYSSLTSAGDDCGFFCRTTTVICKKCKSIDDVVTTKTPWDPESVSVITDLKCPDCSAPVEKWDGQHCPKCKAEMRTLEGFSLLWD
jgi:hypothetical protein